MFGFCQHSLVYLSCASEGVCGWVGVELRRREAVSFSVSFPWSICVVTDKGGKTHIESYKDRPSGTGKDQITCEKAGAGELSGVYHPPGPVPKRLQTYSEFHIVGSSPLL